MAYLFIIDPIESLNKIKDSSLLLMKECLRRNIEYISLKLINFQYMKET